MLKWANSKVISKFDKFKSDLFKLVEKRNEILSNYNEQTDALNEELKTCVNNMDFSDTFYLPPGAYDVYYKISYVTAQSTYMTIYVEYRVQCCRNSDIEITRADSSVYYVMDYKKFFHVDYKDIRSGMFIKKDVLKTIFRNKFEDSLRKLV